jgi:5-methylcytosine-specific restriction endonuclease McrA
MKCYYCGYEADKLTTDHIIPCDKGGRNIRCNKIIACNKCNTIKSNLSLEKFRFKVSRNNNMNYDTRIFMIQQINKLINYRDENLNKLMP